MKTILKRLVPVVMLLSLCSGPAFAQTKMAIVSMTKVFDNFWKTKQGDANLKERKDEIEKTNKEMVDGWKKGKEDWQRLQESANDQAVSAGEREKRKKSADEKLVELKRTEESITAFQRGAIADLNERKAQLRKKIFDEIKTVVTSKAKAGGFALVIDADAQTLVPDPAGPYGMPVLLYQSGENDLTEPVLTQLNAGAPVDITKADEKKDSSTNGSKVPPDAKKVEPKK